MKCIPRRLFTEEFKREAVKLVTEQQLNIVGFLGMAWWHDGAYALIAMQFGLLLLNIRGAFNNPV